MEPQRIELPSALNVPLSDVRRRISQLAPGKEHPLLLHCWSGGRSEIARHLLKRLGYTQVFNLGSYQRARSILGEDPQ